MTKWQLWCDALHHFLLLFKRSKSCANKFASFQFQPSHNSHIQYLRLSRAASTHRELYAFLSFQCGMWVFFRLQFSWIISLSLRELARAREREPNSSHLNGSVLMLSILMKMTVELERREKTFAQSERLWVYACVLFCTTLLLRAFFVILWDV